MVRFLISLLLVVAMLPRPVLSATDRKWKGSVNSEWSIAANWSPTGIPAEGDSVTVDIAANISLSGSTEPLSSLTLGGNGSNLAKITCKGWSTKIVASNVVIKKYGVLTMEACSATSSNRVWISCQNLEVCAGGRIDGDKLGYSGAQGPGWDGVTGTLVAGSGGAYGGLSSTGAGAQYAHCYGSLTQPEDPGSGGYNDYFGGGAVKIVASGNVRVDGTISACGQMSADKGGGSGGSIWIDTKTICGSGEVSVATLDRFSSDKTTHAGGGGRIAVSYDPEAQSAFDNDFLVRFSARGGSSYYGVIAPYNYTETDGYKQTPAFVCRQGQSGTMWFTDYRLLTNAVRNAKNVGLSGRFFSGEPYPEQLLMPGPAIFENAFLEFDESIGELIVDGSVFMNGTNYISSGIGLTGTLFKVHGDVTMKGALIRQVGGITEIDGNLTMSYTPHKTVAIEKGLGSRLDIYAVISNSESTVYGADFKVGKNWTMDKWAVVYPHATDPLNTTTDGYIPYFECLNLDMRPNSYFEAQYCGYGVGKGRGYGSTRTGASHGGLGGATKSQSGYRKNAYGDPEQPVTPGSGSNAVHPGGGAIRVHARNRIDFNGFALANGNGLQSTTSAALGGAWAFGSSGGSVYLSAARFSSTNGYITVRGGRSSTSTYYGGGGGGRVSIWSRALLATNMVIYVEGGKPVTSETNPAEPGTLYWFRNPGAMYLIR